MTTFEDTLSDNNTLLEVKNYIEDSLRTAGVDPNSFDIIPDNEFVLAGTNFSLNVYMAIAKANGMVLLFAQSPDAFMRGSVAGAKAGREFASEYAETEESKEVIN